MRHGSHAGVVIGVAGERPVVSQGQVGRQQAAGLMHLRHHLGGQVCVCECMCGGGVSWLGQQGGHGFMAGPVCVGRWGAHISWLGQHVRKGGGQHVFHGWASMRGRGGGRQHVFHGAQASPVREQARARTLIIAGIYHMLSHALAHPPPHTHTQHTHMRAVPLPPELGPHPARISAHAPSTIHMCRLVHASNTHARTCTQSHTYSHTQSHTQSYTQSYTQSHTYSHSHTHSHTHSHSHTYSHTYSHTRSHTVTHTVIQSHSHTRSHTVTQSHTQSYSHTHKHMLAQV